MSGVEIMQQTLEGGEQLLRDAEFEVPRTFVECPECGEHILRSRQFDHEHEIRFAESFIQTTRGQQELDEVEDEDEPERIGSWYDIELSYSVDYRFRVPAYSEHQAEEIAKDWRLDDRPVDLIHVHTNRREVKEITTEDVPDDFDPCGSERLAEVLLDDE